MSTGFTKLYGSIVFSTVWREPNHVRIVWVTMLALADAKGYVGASIPGLADAAKVSIAECEEALATFMAPDRYSRSKEFEGRRVEVADRGWRLLNYERFRELRTETQVQTAERVRRHREKRALHVTDVTPSNGTKRAVRTEAEAEAEAEAERDRERERAGAREDTAGAGPTSKAPRSSSRGRKPSKPKTAKWNRVPEDWQPNDDHRRIAIENRKNLDAELAKFRDHEYPKPKSDADAAFRNWLRNDFGGGTRNTNGRSTPVQPNYGVKIDAEIIEG